MSEENKSDNNDGNNNKDIIVHKCEQMQTTMQIINKINFLASFKPGDHHSKIVDFGLQIWLESQRPHQSFKTPHS